MVLMQASTDTHASYNTEKVRLNMTLPCCDQGPYKFFVCLFHCTIQHAEAFCRNIRNLELSGSLKELGYPSNKLCKIRCSSLQYYCIYYTEISPCSFFFFFFLKLVSVQCLQNGFEYKQKSCNIYTETGVKYNGALSCLSFHQSISFSNASSGVTVVCHSPFTHLTHSHLCRPASNPNLLWPHALSRQVLGSC